MDPAREEGNDCPEETAQVGARLSNFAQEWERLFNDPVITRTAREGILLKFKTPPPLTRHPIEFPTSQAQRERLLPIVQQLLDKGAIEQVILRHSPGFYSRLFAVPKASGGWRPIIDLSALNQHIDCPHFQMETAESIRHSIRPGEWVTSIDISDAYYHIPVAPPVRKFFRFVLAGEVYQFKALPFGLNTAPREFTQILRPLLKFFRDQGIRVHAYLDDWAVRAPTQADCDHHTSLVLHYLRRLGWKVNFAKSELTPKRDFVFLGMRFDTIKGSVAPAPKHSARIRTLYNLACRRPQWSARQFYSLVGYLQFLAPLTHRGRLHLRPIQRWFRARWVQHSGQWSDIIFLDSELLQLLQWWTLPERFAGVPLQAPDPTMSLCTDASTAGWGAHLDQDEVAGVWSHLQSEEHINQLELTAVKLAVRHFAPLLKGHRVRLYCDNATAIAYLKKEGGTHSESLSRLAENILLQCDSLEVDLLPIHLPGVRNVRADALSRRGVALPGEWSLNPVVLSPIFRDWGTPLLDLFATASNKQTLMYVSPFPDPNAWRIDGLSFPWSDLGLVYAFPPAPILPLVIQQIAKSTNTQVILIAPNLPLKPWFPDLLALRRDGPRPLPLETWPLRQRVPGIRGWVHHLRPEAISLAAWLLSGRN